MKKEQMIPVGVGLLGAVGGLMLHKKYPKFGMAGKIGYAAAGGAAGFFIAKEVMKRMGATTSVIAAPKTEVPMQNA